MTSEENVDNLRASMLRKGISPNWVEAHLLMFIMFATEIR
jgi:hypothetical protein